MKLKPVVALVGAVAILSGANSFAASKDMNAQVNALSAKVKALKQADSKGVKLSDIVSTNANFTHSMTNDQRTVNDVLRVLQARDGQLMNQKIYMGVRTQSVADLGYFKAQNTENGQSGSRLIVPDASLLATATVNNWVSLYGRFKATLISGNSNVSVNDALAVIGNLKQTPFYGFVGKGNVNFGRFESTNNVIVPLTAGAFRANADQLGAGFYQDGINLTLTFMNGGETGNLLTPNSSQVNNFAANASYEGKLNAFNWYVGAGYLNGVDFKRMPTANDTTTRNGVWDVNFGFAVQNFKAIFEYLQTVDKIQSSKVTATAIAAMPSGVEFTLGSGHQAKAWNVGAEYDYGLMGKNVVANVSYSELRSDNATRIGQFVAGVRSETFKNIWLGASFAYTSFKESDSVTNRNNEFTLSASTYF